MSQNKSDKADKDGEKVIAVNRKAKHDYRLEKFIEAGLQLKGSEVKSCRDGKVQLVDAYAGFHNDELWLHKAHIAEWAQGGPYFNHDPIRKRKLLLHRREILKLQAELEQQGYTLIPTRFYFKRGRLKVELALAKGKVKGDKREDIKGREIKRDMDRATRRKR